MPICSLFFFLSVASTDFLVDESCYSVVLLLIASCCYLFVCLYIYLYTGDILVYCLHY